MAEERIQFRLKVCPHQSTRPNGQHTERALLPTQGNQTMHYPLRHSRTRAFRALGFLSLILCHAPPATAQVSFSIDRSSPTMGLPDSFGGAPITPADILAPATASGTPDYGPLPTPGTSIPEAMLGLTGADFHELDALSYGQDRCFDINNQGESNPFGLHFSVDEYALGVPGGAPDVASEAAVADACADVFMSPLGPVPSPPLPGINTGAIDGDGLPSGSGYVYPGLGLIEGTTATNSDDLDALDMESTFPGMDFPPGGVYFSLDTSFVDPLTGAAHSATAIGQGVVGGDILVAPAPGVFTIYAPAPLLGLDIVAGPDSDDLDALILWENGDGDYSPSHDIFPWLSGGDMVLFSVRRGSAVIGMPDSLFGIPICEGDILMPPVFGGAGSPFPAIFIAAENLGLDTARTGAIQFSDDLDAADYVFQAPDLIANKYCQCDVTAPAPCANYDASAGCRNSTGLGGLLEASGSSSVSGILAMTASQLPTGQPGLLFIAPSAATIPFRDGLLCATGTLRRLSIAISGGSGSMSFSGVVAMTAATGVTIMPGETWYLQTWFRDPTGPCGTGSNLTNGVGVLFW
ncbi:MAG: hypothetical protein CMJ87_07030 [Planctomycetes bacterium]|nr:hypothetical protein [Planctomycetota bacterium]